MKSKRIAIIGSGISGLTCAWLLNKEFGDQADVTLFEKNNYFGGHTDTHELTIDGQTLAVDTGFIVFNHHNYPRFTSMLDELGVQSRGSDMSFSVSNRATSFEYHFRGAASLIKNLGLFADQRFRQLFIDLLRFYKLNRDKPLDQIRTQMTLEDYVAHAKLSKAFAQEHLYPMAGALWSMSAAEVKDIPLLFALGFFSNHKMLQLAGRPQWLTVQGGSNQYIKALKAQLKIHWKQEAVQSVKTQASGAGQQVVTTQGEYPFDRVIFACHGDQALSLLSDASAEEQEILSCFEYSDNTMYLHHDARALPVQKKHWASWNVIHQRSEQSQDADHQYSISYWMNLLQGLPVSTPIITTLNPIEPLDSDKIWLKREYQHPKYSQAAYAAQPRWREINKASRYFCGAYWGWGFHEDGVNSAYNTLDALKDDWHEDR